MSVQQLKGKVVQLAEDSNNLNDFSKIYDAYYSRIYNYVRARVINSCIAEDLTSQIFERVYLKLATYCHDKGSFSAWIYKIAQNIIRDYLRARKNTAFPLDETACAVSDTSSRIEDEICRAEIKELLAEALSFLNERERNIIALKFWSDLTNREIAELLSLTDSNVGVTLFRAMRKLKNTLECLGVDLLA